MIDGEIKPGDKLIVCVGDFKGLKLQVRETWMNHKNVKQIVLAYPENSWDFCRESESEVKRLCERDNAK